MVARGGGAATGQESGPTTTDVDGLILRLMRMGRDQSDPYAFLASLDAYAQLLCRPFVRQPLLMAPVSRQATRRENSLYPPS